MTVTVRFFAILRDTTGISETTLESPSGNTVADAAGLLVDRFPNIAKYRSRIAYAVNERFVPIDTQLHDGDELALIPPVSGGSSDDWLDLLQSPLDIAKATEFVTSPIAGGLDIFLGTTRAETSTAGQALIALDYHAYESMARRQMQELSDQARVKWPIIRLAILHRLGRVPIGDSSVLIAVSTPHRAEAFDACRWIIDQLKKEVTIWKQEIWKKGEPTWVHPNHPPV